MGRRFDRVVIKAGSNVLTREDGTLDSLRMEEIVKQISALHKDGCEILLISSGAVACGRAELHLDRKLDAVSARQLYSAAGQAKLINRYYDLFSLSGIHCGQILTTKESLSTRDHYLNQENCMRVMLGSGVIPIINENDTISVTELMFTDNDELSGMVASMMDADCLVILSNVDGIYNGNPESPDAEVIREVHHGDDLGMYIRAGKSSFGRGGMLTKCRIASKVADEGIEVIIANGKKDGIIGRILSEEIADTVCTRFLPSRKPVSRIKRWIAHSDGFAKGEYHVNEGAMEALFGETATSLLPIGVTKVEGEFSKGDIVKLVSPEGMQIGLGKTCTDSGSARLAAGKKGGKPLIHYDYLYLE